MSGWTDGWSDDMKSLWIILLAHAGKYCNGTVFAWCEPKQPSPCPWQRIYSFFHFVICSLFTIVLCLPHFVYILSFDALLLFLSLHIFCFKCNCENAVLFTFVMAKMVFRFHSFITRSWCARVRIAIPNANAVSIFKSVCSARNGTNNRIPNVPFLCALSKRNCESGAGFLIFMASVVAKESWKSSYIFILLLISIQTLISFTPRYVENTFEW